MASSLLQRMPSCDKRPPPSCNERPPPSLDRWPPHSMGGLLTQRTVASLNERPGSCCSTNGLLTQRTVSLLNEWSCRSTNALLAQQTLSLLNEQSLPVDLLHGLPPLINGLGLSPTLTNGLLGLPPTSVNDLLGLPLTPQMVSALLQQRPHLLMNGLLFSYKDAAQGLHLGHEYQDFRWLIQARRGVYTAQSVGLGNI